MFFKILSRRAFALQFSYSPWKQKTWTMNLEELYLEEFLEFLPKKRRKRAKSLMKHLMSQPGVKIRNNAVYRGRHRMGHLSTMLVALFLPKLHKSTEENMKLFLQWEADARAHAKLDRKRKTAGKKVKNLIVCPAKGVCMQ